MLVVKIREENRETNCISAVNHYGMQFSSRHRDRILKDPLNIIQCRHKSEDWEVWVVMRDINSSTIVATEDNYT